MPRGPAPGLHQLEGVPVADRSGDYYLARAQMLAASGRPEDAAAALEAALAASPARPDWYQQAAAFLTRNGKTAEALRLLDPGARLLPQNRELLVVQAAALELAGKTADADRLLNQVQNRWPEWHAGWVAHGMVLASRGQFEKARQALETAIALGARSPEVRTGLGQCKLRLAPKDPGSLLLGKPPRDW